MEDFLYGVLFGIIFFGMPRVFFGTFHIWSATEGWVLKWRTADQWERDLIEYGKNLEKQLSERDQ